MVDPEDRCRADDVASQGRELLSRATTEAEWSEAFRLLKKSYDMGRVVSAKELYEGYRNSGYPTEAWIWLTRWAEMTEDPEACFRVGQVLQQGILVKADIYYAAEWYRKAASRYCGSV